MGGLLKNTNTESMNSQEKQLYCAGEKVNIGDQIFVAKENEVFTVADIMTDGTVVTTPNINGCTRYFRPELIRLLNASGTGDAIKSPSYEPNVPEDYAWRPDGVILEVASMYPPLQLTLDNVQIHGKICQELTETYKKKNADYGNSFENSLDKHGLIAGIVRMDDKMSRLISLNSKNEQLVNDESVRDTLMDLANYAIMSVMWLDNKSGEESDGGYLSPTVYGAVDLTDKGSFSRPIGVCTVHTPEEWEKLRADIKSGAEEFDSDLLTPGAGIIGASDRDIYADNQKLDIDKALREGAHPQAIRDF